MVFSKKQDWCKNIGVLKKTPMLKKIFFKKRPKF